MALCGCLGAYFYIWSFTTLIFQGKWVLPALKQLLQIAKNIAKQSFNKAEKVTFDHSNVEIINNI